MSVRPERIDAQLLTKGGSLRSVQIKLRRPRDQRLRRRQPGLLAPRDDPVRADQPGAPARLARGAAGRSRKPVSQIDYVVLLSFAGRPMWSGFMKGGGAVPRQRARPDHASHQLRRRCPVGA